ncbi:hypothetical protein B5G34_00420 [Flavonifractor sp. An82]|uniref:DUF4121 family protein n=1 Tax=Flavonifractor sp. An82 TaxID=1965660 RepID=UPI000B37E3C9|nr:DUF4121 family protein [Flavonifractor sp. An82]OUN23598.1 hypothetical protein B5G34_00420 [Flavonifractor sp. An82]
MYTIESLSDINHRFVRAHFRITQDDVDHINALIKYIESSRKDSPMAGDVVRLTNKWSEYYPHAHIESDAKGELHICESPYIPFVYVADDALHFTTSGGAWGFYKSSDLRYVGKELKYFCDWGHCGPCADGAIDFQAEVSVWEYISPDLKYGEYTTKDWERHCVHHLSKPDEFGYRYVGDGVAFKTDAEYFAWLSTYHGVEFEGSIGDSGKTYVVFTYKKDCYYISRQEWDELPLPTDTRMMNCSIIPIKYLVDDDNHIIHEYRYTNRVENNDRTDIAYRVGFNKVKSGDFERMLMNCGKAEN